MISFFAYYYGSGAVGLSPSQVSMLTKLLIGDTGTVTEAFTTSSNVSYFAYPDSYPALTKILDNNGFNVTSDWSVSTGNNIVNGFGQTDTYRIYEFNIPNTNVNFNYTFIQ